VLISEKEQYLDSDYTDAARGMIYRANTASVGVAVDGVPDADVSDGTPLEWETLSGPMGSLLTRHEIETTADGFEPVLYYADDDRNPPRQCTGDGAALGQSGLWIPQSVPSTDPRLGSSTVMRSTRTVLLSPTPLTEAEQDATLAAMASSMTVTVAPVGTSAEADRVVQTRLTVAPNPTAGAATVSFSVTAPTDVRVSVVDALGREVWRAGDRRLGAGPHRVALDLSRLAPGWYAVRVATETSVSTHPLMRR
ncbi:MAG: T9SS type A sorting domain-containing protein, partial [Bacteroidota bacterium]